MARLTYIATPGAPERWRMLGFELDGTSFDLDGVRFEVDSAPGWGFDEVGGELPVPASTVAVAGSPAHPNGIIGIDHVVLVVGNLDEATSAIEAVLELELRRRFHPRGPEGPEMAFYRAGPAVIEVVAAPTRPALSGVAFLSRDLDATVEAIRAAGGPIGDPKPAVQGGRIASVWRDHFGWGVAVMEGPR